MNFQLKHRHTDCPPELREMIERKVERFERVIPENAYLEVKLEPLPKVQNDGDKQVDVLLDIPGVTPVIRFCCNGMTFIEALDKALDHLDDELSRRKNRDGDHMNGVSPKEMVIEDTVNAE